MKTITIDVSEPVYADFREHAQKIDRSTSELIREAMEEYRDRRIKGGISIRDMHPIGLEPRGDAPASGSHEGDLLGKMLHDLRT
jgi:Arc/MetJ-type ribon-helix-helix transcriptional regulator